MATPTPTPAPAPRPGDAKAEAAGLKPTLPAQLDPLYAGWHVRTCHERSHLAVCFDVGRLGRGLDEMMRFFVEAVRVCGPGVDIELLGRYSVMVSLPTVLPQVRCRLVMGVHLTSELHDLHPHWHLPEGNMMSELLRRFPAAIVVSATFNTLERPDRTDDADAKAVAAAAASAARTRVYTTGRSTPPPPSLLSPSFRFAPEVPVAQYQAQLKAALSCTRVCEALGLQFDFADLSTCMVLPTMMPLHRLADSTEHRCLPDLSFLLGTHSVIEQEWVWFHTHALSRWIPFELELEIIKERAGMDAAARQLSTTAAAVLGQGGDCGPWYHHAHSKEPSVAMRARTRTEVRSEDEGPGCTRDSKAHLLDGMRTWFLEPDFEGYELLIERLAVKMVQAVTKHEPPDRTAPEYVAFEELIAAQTILAQTLLPRFLRLLKHQLGTPGWTFGVRLNSPVFSEVELLCQPCLEVTDLDLDRSLVFCYSQHLEDCHISPRPIIEYELRDIMGMAVLNSPVGPMNMNYLYRAAPYFWTVPDADAAGDAPHAGDAGAPAAANPGT